MKIFKQAEQYPQDPHYDDYGPEENDWEHQREQEEMKSRASGGGHKVDLGGPKTPKPPVIRNDDIRLMQPQESGLEYPVIVKRNPKGDGWDVLKSLA